MHKCFSLSIIYLEKLFYETIKCRDSDEGKFLKEKEIRETKSVGEFVKVENRNYIFHGGREKKRKLKLRIFNENQ